MVANIGGFSCDPSFQWLATESYEDSLRSSRISDRRVILFTYIVTIHDYDDISKRGCSSADSNIVN